MSYLRAILTLLFRHYASPRAIKGGSGHYNEQCHPNTYG
jgi:hypothetical protein